MNDTMIQMMKLGQKGYSCAQILISLALEVRGAKPIPDWFGPWPVWRTAAGTVEEAAAL